MEIKWFVSSAKSDASCLLERITFCNFSTHTHSQYSSLTCVLSLLLVAALFPSLFSFFRATRSRMYKCIKPKDWRWVRRSERHTHTFGIHSVSILFYQQPLSDTSIMEKNCQRLQRQSSLCVFSYSNTPSICESKT